MTRKVWRILVWLSACCLVVVVPARAERLAVVTVNVWSGLDYKGNFVIGEYETEQRRQRRYELLIDGLQRLEPDVIALNEANMLPDYAERAAQDLGYDMSYHVGVGGVRIGWLGFPINMREGDVLLARPALGFTARGRVQLSGGYVGNVVTAHLSDATQAIAARVEVAGRSIHVVNTHWHSSAFADRDILIQLVDRYVAGQVAREQFVETVVDAEQGSRWRLSEARKTLAFVDSVAGSDPVVLMGDFNALPGSPEIKLLTAAGFVDAFAEAGQGPGHTWDEVGNRNIAAYYPQDEHGSPRQDRIDYIFVRGSDVVQIRNARVVLDGATDNVHPSDHYGVFAELDVKAAE